MVQETRPDPLRLRQFLETMEDRCDRAERRSHDPVELVWNYDDPADQEVVALLAASMAYGQVAVLKEAVRKVLELLGPHPHAFLVEGDVAALSQPLEGFVYRMTRGDDVLDLLFGLRSVLREYGSLEGCYLDGPADHLEAMSHLIGALRAGRLRDEMARGFRYLITDPTDGSTAKRMHLFTRWMVRGPDAIDLGIWSEVPASALVMPLDTHTSRICRYLGLTSRRSNDLKTALEVTEGLRMLDPDDPLRFDFAICHLGMSKACVHTWSDDHCPTCPIEPVCRIAAGTWHETAAN